MVVWLLKMSMLVLQSLRRATENFLHHVSAAASDLKGVFFKRNTFTGHNHPGVLIFFFLFKFFSGHKQ